MTKKLTLDRTHLIQMAKSLDFYIAVPAFVYLRDAALKSWEMTQNAKECQRCGAEWKHMRGVCDAMLLKLQELKAEDPESITQIKDWLSQRKGYTVEQCVLYYRRSHTQGKIFKIQF